MSDTDSEPPSSPARPPPRAWMRLLQQIYGKRIKLKPLPPNLEVFRVDQLDPALEMRNYYVGSCLIPQRIRPAPS